MNKTRVLLLTVLCVITGAVLGFGLTSLQYRQALAEPLHLNTLQQPSPQVNAVIPGRPDAAQVNLQSTVGVGGSFVTDVYKKASPAVVHITNRAVRTTFDFFRGPQEYVAEATGSGFIVDERGYILTNHHVIQNANEIIVVLNDGQEFSASVIGSDPGTDLALIKIETTSTLPVVTLGDSSAIEVGEWVVAIGNPRGLDWTVTTGVISATGREIVAKATGQTIRDLIQTDASINPGNSGGPLLNARGEVIGINDAIVSTSGGSQGTNLAIPINLAKEVLEDLVQHGRVIRPWLGVELYKQINRKMALQMNLPVDYGEIIWAVYENSPAAKGGVIPYFSDRRRGGHFQFDILVAIDGEKLDKDRELLDIIRNHKEGDKVKLDIYRVTDGEFDAVEAEVTLEAIPEEAPLLGII